MIEMELMGVRIEAPANVPCVLLRERTGAQRVLPIFIGPAEAQAIVLALDGEVLAAADPLGGWLAWRRSAGGGALTLEA